MDNLPQIEIEDEDKIFKKPKKKKSEFKCLEWAEQVYSIQQYLEFGVYPMMLPGSHHKEMEKEFWRMVKKNYVFEKETRRLMKLVKQKKLNQTGSWLSKKSPPTCYHIKICSLIT